MSGVDVGVIKRESLTEMVDSYNQACRNVDQAFELLEVAKIRLESSFGGYGFDCISLMRYHNKPDEIKSQLKKAAWETLLDRIEIKKVMSNKAIDELHKSFENIKDIPEITLTSLNEIIMGMLENAPEYAKGMYKEAYEILMPGNNQNDEYKTNKKNARRSLGKKVIITWVVEISYGGRYGIMGSRSEERLLCVDKVFHILDGKGIPKGYRSPLIDAIVQTETGRDYGETEYFKFRCCKNRNLHLEFKRMDLVEKLNRVAGNSTTLTD